MAIRKIPQYTKTPPNERQMNSSMVYVWTIRSLSLCTSLHGAPCTVWFSLKRACSHRALLFSISLSFFLYRTRTYKTSYSRAIVHICRIWSDATSPQAEHCYHRPFARRTRTQMHTNTCRHSWRIVELLLLLLLLLLPPLLSACALKETSPTSCSEVQSHLHG